MQYNVGDEVILKVKITDTDYSACEGQTYCNEDRFWFRESNIIGVAAKVEPQPKPEPEPEPEPTFKVGDRVVHRNMLEWGVGTVEEVNKPRAYTDAEYTSPGVETQEYYDGIRYTVKYPNKNTYGFRDWTSSDKYLVKAIL
jgi:hypothetical protein